MSLQNHPFWLGNPHLGVGQEISTPPPPARILASAPWAQAPAPAPVTGKPGSICQKPEKTSIAETEAQPFQQDPHSSAFASVSWTMLGFQSKISRERKATANSKRGPRINGWGVVLHCLDTPSVQPNILAGPVPFSMVC